MKKLFIETYGCQMNVADSEVVASVMQMAGYETTDNIDEADAVFLNTCSAWCSLGSLKKATLISSSETLQVVSLNS